MIQLSSVAFSLMVETIVVTLVILSAGSYQAIRRYRRDRHCAARLVEQIRHQSDLRLKQTGSFLKEKYQLEGKELDKAIHGIDQAEKKFMQTLINMYLQRDADGLLSMDASMAELIEAYKELTPAQPAASNTHEEDTTKLADDHDAELEALRATNAKLREELSITKKTMGNMIAEFGNMFGGGQDTSLEKEEVLEKVNVIDEGVDALDSAEELAVAPEEDLADENTLDEVNSVSAETQDAVQSNAAATTGAEAEPAAEKKKQMLAQEDEDLLSFDEGIDELMDGIDLSEDS